MINIAEGQINLGAENICVFSNYNDLDGLTERGLIESRKDIDGSGDYFYVESATDGSRFGVTISLREKRVDYILLRWLDSPMKSWDDVSDEALADEYRLLLDFVENRVGRPPDSNEAMQRTWNFKWGHVNVSYQPRSFDASIYMVPR